MPRTASSWGSCGHQSESPCCQRGNTELCSIISPMMLFWQAWKPRDAETSPVIQIQRVGVHFQCFQWTLWTCQFLFWQRTLSSFDTESKNVRAEQTEFNVPRLDGESVLLYSASSPHRHLPETNTVFANGMSNMAATLYSGTCFYFVHIDFYLTKIHPQRPFLFCTEIGAITFKAYK